MNICPFPPKWAFVKELTKELSSCVELNVTRERESLSSALKHTVDNWIRGEYVYIENKEYEITMPII